MNTDGADASVIADATTPSPAATRFAAAPPSVVHRSLHVLRALAESPSDVSVSTLADDLGLPRSTVHRILNLFKDEGFVTPIAESRRYQVGAELYRIAALITSRRNVVELALPTMKRVVERSSETCLLGLYLPARRAMMFAAKVDSPDPLGYRIELFHPVSVAWGASGRAILAWLPHDEIDDLLAEEQAASAEGERLDPQALAGELESIRERGYAQTIGQKVAGSYGLAAPIFTAGGGVVGCLCVTMPGLRVKRGQEKSLAPLVVGAAHEVSEILGHRNDSAAAAP